MTIYPFTFRILDQAEIKVIVDNVVQTITTDYTVSGVGDDSGGNITFVTAPANLASIVFVRDMSFTQELDLRENDQLPAESLEQGLDELTMNDQQLQETQDRCLKVSEDATTLDVDIPDYEANKYLKVDGAGTALQWDTVSSGAGLLNIVEDTTPQLGGDLDCNTQNIQFDDNTGIQDDSGNEQLIFQKTASAVNHLEITNAATGNNPKIAAVGDDANIDLRVDMKGSGKFGFKEGANRIVDIEENTTGPGNQLTIQAGNALASASDVNGGDMVLASGSGEGTGSSSIRIQTSKAGSSGSTTNTVANRVVINGDSVDLEPHGTSAGDTMPLRFKELVANGSNLVSLKAPDSITSNVNLTLPNTAAAANNDVLVSDTSGNLSFLSNNALAKFWIKFNGTGTIAINDSYNVTSITDDGTGLYTVTIDTDFATADWCCVITRGSTTTNDDSQSIASMAAGSVQVEFAVNSLAADQAIVCVVGFGDQ